MKCFAKINFSSILISVTCENIKFVIYEDFNFTSFTFSWCDTVREAHKL